MQSERGRARAKERGRARWRERPSERAGEGVGGFQRGERAIERQREGEKKGKTRTAELTGDGWDRQEFLWRILGRHSLLPRLAPFFSSALSLTSPPTPSYSSPISSLFFSHPVLLPCLSSPLSASLISPFLSHLLLQLLLR